MQNTLIALRGGRRWGVGGGGGEGVLGNGGKGCVCVVGGKGGRKGKKKQKKKQVLHHPHGVIHMQAHTHKNV